MIDENDSVVVTRKGMEYVGPNIDVSPRKVLYVMHMPPPVHGASMVGKYIRESKLLQHCFNGVYINMTAASDLNDIGKWRVNKVVDFVKMLIRVRKSIKHDSPHLIYLTPNAKGIPFYKDFITVLLVKHWAGYSLLDGKWLKKNNRYCETKNSNIKRRKANVLVHYHNKGVKNFSQSQLNNWLYKIFFKNLYVLLLGDALYEDVKKYVPQSRVFICGNGLPEFDNDVESKIVENFELKSKSDTYNPLHILYLSNMMEEKGVWTLIDACKLLKEKGIDFKCTFVGGWKDITEDAFKKKVVNLGLQTKVHAVGAVYGVEKEPYWLDADVFVFPTYYHNECFPLVLLEAMQHALPCISTKEGAIRNIIDDGDTGFVVNAKKPDDLASKIIELANAKHKRLDMGLKGYRKFKEQYTLKDFEKRMCDILEQLTLDRVNRFGNN